MDTRQDTWRSPSLGKDMTIRVYGDSGTPIIGLPTRGQCSDQWEECGMTEAIKHQLVNGYNQLFCIDTVDNESLLNKKAEPAKRLMRQQQYETYVIEEVVPYVHKHNASRFLMITGVDLGGYHAINLALKHPQDFNKAIGISGLYDIRDFYGDFYSDGVYYNNPLDFVPNLNKKHRLDKIRDVDLRFVSYANDVRQNQALRLAHVCRTKFIDHELDIWDLESDEEWDLWKKMLKTHII